MEIILTHENADFDAVAGLMAASKLYPEAVPLLPERLNQNVAHFLALYGLPFTRQSEVKLKQVKRVILVDNQRSIQIKGVRASTPLHIIDHHPLARELAKNQTFEGETVGAVTTLLVEKLRQQNIALTALEATLLALGIYEDTGALTYGTTTPRDLEAAAWLLASGAAIDTIRQFLTPALTPQQQDLLDQLVAHTESRMIEGHTIILASVALDYHVSEISAVAHRLRDLLAPTALFVLVEMPHTLQLVARSADDAVDAGEIARTLGGGGHGRAAAASIHGKTRAEAAEVIWQTLEQQVQPVTRVFDLMSFGVHTVEADETLDKLAGQLRRIGHEGYPVVEGGQVVGLLTRRDLDRALEHGLGGLPVRDIMLSGKMTLQPQDSVSALEQRMADSGWGQIPVVETGGRLIGIVTRTDLIKHWARRHPAVLAPETTLAAQQIEQLLGQATAALIHKIAERADEQSIKMYLVGGVVRDLLLNRRNLDIDFVVEGKAINFAQGLAKAYGGHVSAFSPFGTAKWSLDEDAASALQLPLVELPEFLDFASSRNEFYEHPTALPTVYDSSIKLDLLRRDFTINTLAVQVSPLSAFGRVLDFYGGLRDLRAGLIRALHSLSFVDDPTRVLRAVRFERRLGFSIEARTAELIASALPMLGRITGERVRNELNLLLSEAEPEKGLLELEQLGILEAIHAAFHVDARIIEPFGAARTAQKPWSGEALDLVDLYWHILAAFIPVEALEKLTERLMFGKGMSESLLGAAKLPALTALLAKAEAHPSDIVYALEGTSEAALLGAWLATEDADVRERIRLYWTKWRQVRPVTTGHTLREMGLPTGPCYSLILKRLREAWLDEIVHNEAGEKLLLRKLVEDEAICHDSA